MYMYVYAYYDPMVPIQQEYTKLQQVCNDLNQLDCVRVYIYMCACCIKINISTAAYVYVRTISIVCNFCAPSKFELIEMCARENASWWYFVKKSEKFFLFTIEYVLPSGRHNVEVRITVRCPNVWANVPTSVRANPTPKRAGRRPRPG